MDWEQLLSATFDPADPAMFLGPDDMFSLNRNDLLYAQKYSAARTTQPATQQPALNDHDLERCANDLDRFVNDLELACANIGQQDSDVPDAKRDLDPNVGQSQGHSDNTNVQRSSPSSNTADFIDGRECNSASDLAANHCLRNSDDNVDRCQDSVEDDNSQKRALCDFDTGELGDLGVNNGPDIALCELTDDVAAVSLFPYDPDPEATVV